MTGATCPNPRCGAPRVGGHVCPRCGVIYAKAEARAARPQPPAVVAPPPPQPLPPPPAPLPIPEAFAIPSAYPEPREPVFEPDFEDSAEFRLRLVAIPAALVVAWLLMHTNTGRFLGRLFFSMWIHELGHAISAWFCGFHAVPLPWFTPVADNRSVVVAAMLAAPIIYFGVKAWQARHKPVIAVAAVLLVAQIVCTLGLSLGSARAFFIFGGDAGCLVIGTLLILTFFSSAQSKLRRHHLRWGFLVIGAISFMDAFEQWWAARTDSDRIAYGMHQYAGLSDASKLTETYGWTEPQMVRAYVVLGIACLLVIALIYARELWRSGLLHSLRRIQGGAPAPPR